MPRKTHHVVPDKKEGGWKVKKGGVNKPLKRTDTEKEGEKWKRSA